MVSVPPEATLLEVARLMRTRHVGSILVVEKYHPVGILTDRGIVVKVMAAESDPKAVQAKEIMASLPALVNVNYDPLDAAWIMWDRGLRWLPVVNENRHMLGIVTLDDVLGLLETKIANLAEAVPGTTASRPSSPSSFSIRGGVL